MSDPVGRYLAAYRAPTQAGADPVAGYLARYAGPPPSPAPPVQAQPSLAAGVFATPTLPRPVGPTGAPLPPIGRTPQEQLVLNAGPSVLSPAAIHGQVQAEDARQAQDALLAQADPTGAQRFVSGALAGLGTQVATLPTRAAHGALTLGSAISSLSASAAGRPDVAHRIQMAALTGRTTAPVDAATTRIGTAIAGRLPVSGVPGRVGEFVGSQVPGIAAWELATPERLAGTPLLGRIAQSGTAGGLAGMVTQPQDPSAGLQGLAYGAGGEALLGAIPAVRSAFGGAEPPPETGIPATGDRRAPVTELTPPSPFQRRVADAIYPKGAKDRLNPVTGLPGAALWEDAKPLADAHPGYEVLEADAVGLKPINKQVSEAHGDALIRAQADAYRQAVLEQGLDPNKVLYTPKGDELYAVLPRGLAQTVGERATALMGKEPLLHPTTGEAFPTGTRFGVGPTSGEANTALNAAVAAEKAGRTPPLTEAPPVAPPTPEPPPSSGPFPNLRDESGRIGVRGNTPLEQRTVEEHAALLRANGAPDAAENLERFMDGSQARKVVFRGDFNAGRLGSRFLKNRATSGRFFFTEDPAIASNYAEGKTYIPEGEEDYNRQFAIRVGPGKSGVVQDVDRAWWYLTPQQQSRVLDTYYNLGQNEDGAFERGNGSIAGRDHLNYVLQREARGNGLTALKDLWLQSGHLFGDEGRFTDILKDAGLEAEYRNPHVGAPGVGAYFLDVKRPIATDNVPKDVMEAWATAAKYDRSRGTSGVDIWDKNSRSFREWFQEVRNDDGHHLWATSLPDKAVQIAQSLGYDGLKDTGGKMGGPEHPVWVAFEPNQIKSATGNRGTFSSTTANTAGRGAIPILGALSGGIGGAAAGYASGQTPEERVRNAALLGIAGAGLGAGAGRLVEGAGDEPVPAPARSVAPPTPEPAEPVETGTQGPLRAPEAQRIRQLGDASPETVARVENYARQQPGPGHESWGDLETRVEQARQRVGGSVTPADIRAWRQQGLDRVQVGAMVQVLQENQARMDDLAKVLTDPGASASAKAAAQAEWNGLDRQSFDIFKSVKGAGTESGRNLAALQKTWGTLGQTDAAWQYRGEQIAERPLTAVERAKLVSFDTPAKRLQYLGTLSPMGPMNQLVSQWMSGLLTGAAIAKKAVGDVSFATARELGRPISGSLDWLASLATGVRTEGMTPQVGARLRGVFGATGRDEFRRAMLGLPSRAEEAAGEAPRNTSVPPTMAGRTLAGAGIGALTGAMAAGPGHRLKGAAAGGAAGAFLGETVPQTQPFFNALVQGPFRVLKGVSNAFAEGAYRASIASQVEAAIRQAKLTGSEAARARASLLERPTDPMQAIAQHDAAYETMTDETALSKAGRAIQSLPGGKVVAPFNRTPASITTKLLVDANPAAAPYSAVQLGRTMRQGVKEMLATGEVSPATRLAQHKFVTQLGVQGAMSLPFVYGYIAYLHGRASGTSDPTARGERGLRAEQGVPDDAFLLGGKWVNWNGLGLPGMEMALGANTAAALQRQNDDGTPVSAAGKVGALAQAGGRVALDNPFFVGVNQAQQVLGGEGNAGERYARSLTGSLVPAAVRNVAAMGDPYRRTADSPADQFTAGVPGQRGTLPVTRGILGAPLVNSYGQGAQGFSPVKVTTPDTTHADLLREWDRLGVGVNLPKRLPGETATQYNDRLQQVGQYVTQMAGQVLGPRAPYGPQYQSLPPDKQADWWQDQLSAAGRSTRPAGRQRITADSARAAR